MFILHMTTQTASVLVFVSTQRTIDSRQRRIGNLHVWLQFTRTSAFAAMKKWEQSRDLVNYNNYNNYHDGDCYYCPCFITRYSNFNFLTNAVCVLDCQLLIKAVSSILTDKLPSEKAQKSYLCAGRMLEWMKRKGKQLFFLQDL